MVNGSATKELELGKGLRQGDPLSPFLFVLAAECLTCPLRRASAIGEFLRFSVGEKCVLDILQFADDTLLLGEGNWRQVWALKVVLMGFEVTSGLGINFHKSRLIGINTSAHFLGAAGNFLLSCRIEDNSFTFLGVPIGCNPRRIAMWKPFISKLKARQDNWKGRFLSFCGRITLLKSDLSSLTIFQLSFYKTPVSVCK